MMKKWYQEQGVEGDVVISSRIRLARNLSKYPFGIKLSPESAGKLLDEIKNTVEETTNSFNFIHLKDLNAVEKQVFVEKHLMSHEMLKDSENKALLLSDDESVSVMVNEEDHLRIQCLCSGLELDKLLKLANKVDDLLESRLDFAFHEKFGYLTCCPTNVGTGMRASIMLHLPALFLSGSINELINSAGKLGIAVRGLYGEGSESSGYFYQFSNQISLGMSENDFIDKLKGVAEQIITLERGMRKKLYDMGSEQLTDKVMRAYGILKHARVMTTEEFLKLYADVRLGVCLGIINDVGMEDLSSLMIEIQPANLIQNSGKNISATERDMLRTKLIREKLDGRKNNG